MLFAEYDREEELRIAREEALEDGIEKGIENVAKEMLRKGAEVDFVSGVTKLEKEKIMELQKEINSEKQA